MNKFRKALKEDMQLTATFGQKSSSGGQGSVGPARNNHSDLSTSVAEAIPEEENRKSHDTQMFPFPLEHIAEYLCDTYETIIKTRFALSNCLRSGITFDTPQKKLIKKDIAYLNKCIDVIKKISRDVEEMKI